MNNVFGFHAVTALLHSQSTSLQKLFIQHGREDKRLHAILELARQYHITVEKLSRQQLDDFTEQANHQGVVAVLAGKQAAFYEEDLPTLLDNIQAPPLLLILDNITDPHNLGACLRCADAAGVHAVIAPKDKAVGMTPVVRKVACGAAESVPFIQVTNLARTLKQLKEYGIWLYGTDGAAEQSLYQQDLTGPVALVMGAEGEGLRRLTKESCDFLVSLPMGGSVSSLNVSVATGICLFEAVRQRSI